MDDLYTSLLSNQSYSFQQDSSSSYFSGSAGGKSVGGGSTGTSSGGGGLMDDFMSGLDSHAMFSSDSGIEMTPGDPSDPSSSSRKLAQDSDRGIGGIGNIGAGGITSDYNYMDISRPQQQQHSPLDDDDDDDWGSIGSNKPSDLLSGLGGMGSMGASSISASSYMEKAGSGLGDVMGSMGGGGGSAAGAAVEVETLGPALDAQSFPYVEEPSDEELSDYQPYRSPGAGSSASPVKITLTETPSPPSPSSLSPSVPVAMSEKESILSLGLEGVPTVTLSEPEDESPGSSTPPLTEESDSPSDHKYKSGDSKSFPQDKSPAPPQQPSPPAEKATPPVTTGPSSVSAFPRSSHDAEGSSGGESGDSEIELVSEEPAPTSTTTTSSSSRSGAGSSSYMSFSKPPAPAPAPTPTPAPASAPASALLSGPPSASAATLNQYSILREEREAELDSELALESCGEESPKRGLGLGLRLHDSPAPKGAPRKPDVGLFAAPAPATAVMTAPLPPPAAPSAPPAVPTAPAPAPVPPKAPASAPAPAVEEVRAKPTPSIPSSTPATTGPLEPKQEKAAAEDKPGERRSPGQSKGPDRQLPPPPPLFQGLTREKDEMGALHQPLGRDDEVALSVINGSVQGRVGQEERWREVVVVVVVVLSVSRKLPEGEVRKGSGNGNSVGDDAEKKEGFCFILYLARVGLWLCQLSPAEVSAHRAVLLHSLSLSSAIP
ncbi:hypothetical protein ACEWY4_022111 [Coilia grayii]|uniref:Uncharacterized protein n=1 Tax=Coilia grayii TaxID=363190 RepID=A0ABD1J8J8_9TELE